jgi:chaperonin GroES
MATQKSTKKFSLSPLSDRVVVRPLKKSEERMVGGIIIPDTVSKEKPERGTVVAAGPGRYDDGALIPMTLSVGDEVIFSKYGFEEVKIDGEEYYIISESNVLAVITK